MPKNVLVVDESGTSYGATWPKRAKGLVNKGRARFIDENTICLACPPDTEILEDIIMSDNNTITAKTEPKLTVEYILSQIELIRKDTDYLKESIAAVKELNSADMSAQDQADALGKIVHEREETNRVILDFYRKMYEDLNEKAHALKILEKVAENPGNLPVGEITNMMYKLLGIEKTGK